MSSKLKTKTKVVIVFQNLLSIIFNIGVLIMVSSFFIVFMKAHIEYFRELPDIFLIFIPIGFIGIMTKIVMINWWGFYLNSDELAKLNDGSNEEGEK